MTQDRTLVADLFRQSAGQMVSTLTRIFGVRHLDLAEECVQEAMIRALEVWPYRGIPENPRAWLIQTARNKALDVLRRGKLAATQAAEVERALYAAAASPNAPLDDQLGMILLCCHASLTQEAQVALTLKTVGGFSVKEIARAFLADESTVAQRLVRAKRKLAALPLPFDFEASLATASTRMPAVLEVLYLLFNEGYSAHAGDQLLRRDISEEAIRLASLIARDERLTGPAQHALAALMLLQSARDPARINADGDLSLLRDQDRSLWDQSRIALGYAHLERAASGLEETRYHLEAAIAASHSSAPNWESTNWPHIRELYDRLAAMHPTSIVLLNRAVAIGQVDGPQAALQALDQIGESGAHPLNRYHLYWAARAEMLLRLGERGLASDAAREAIALARTEPEKRFLLRMIDADRLQ